MTEGPTRNTTKTETLLNEMYEHQQQEDVAQESFTISERGNWGVVGTRSPEATLLYEELPTQQQEKS